MGAVQTGVQFWVVFYEGNQSFLCDTKHTITLSFHATCEPDHHSTCARCGPYLGRQINNNYLSRESRELYSGFIEVEEQPAAYLTL